MIKAFGPFFRRIIDCDKPQETIYWGPHALLTITLELIGAFFKDLRGC